MNPPKSLSFKTVGGAHPVHPKTIVYGLSGVGKTTLCLSLALQALEQGHSCLYIDCEDKLRSNSLFNIIKTKPDIMSKLTVWTHITEENRDALFEELKKHNHDVVILDSYTGLFVQYLGKNQRKELKSFMAKLISATRGRTLITVHHGYNRWGAIDTSLLQICGGDQLAYFADEVIRLRVGNKGKRLIHFRNADFESVLPNNIDPR